MTKVTATQKINTHKMEIDFGDGDGFREVFSEEIINTKK